jgi:hypothetical protein
METKGDLSYFFIIGTLFILTLLYFLIRKIGFRKMISQILNLLLIIMFQYLKKNYGKTCFDIVFRYFQFFYFLGFYWFCGWWLLLILIQMVFFVQKNWSIWRNSIYIATNDSNSIDQEEKRISKAGQFLRKYKLDNCRCLMFWKVKWVLWDQGLIYQVDLLKGRIGKYWIKAGLNKSTALKIYCNENC